MSERFGVVEQCIVCRGHVDVFEDSEVAAELRAGRRWELTTNVQLDLFYELSHRLSMFLQVCRLISDLLLRPHPFWIPVHAPCSTMLFTASTSLSSSAN